MTAAEKRVAALLWLADAHRDGYDIDIPLRAVLPDTEPAAYIVHWQRVCELVAEAADVATGKADYINPVLSRLPMSQRPEIADQLADELRIEARGAAVCCLMVNNAHARQARSAACP